MTPPGNDMNKLFDILKQPYPYYIPFSRSFKLLIFLSMTIPLFLIVFKPFGLNFWEYEYKYWVLAGMALPIFLTLVTNFYGVVKLLPKFFNEDTWSIGKEITWSLWNFFTIVLATGYYWTLVPTEGISGIHWGQHMFYALLLAFVPGSFCIYFNHNRALRRKLEKAHVLNEGLATKMAFYESGMLTLVAENQNDKITVSTDHLILIQSYDNYSKVVWEDKGSLMSNLIRSSLKKIETQINFPFIIRCHRSFVVNLSKVEKFEANARDYRLRLSDYPDLVPVSRDSYRKVLNLFEEFSPATKSASGVSYSTKTEQ